ncbi:hypothetical protein QFC22_000767 [Naganishia vaughanmartiniae]|uniref:Uncharacterized protein n=1 Tax=Naganishia vaughanmartiniae TaxID=1424756 RepID=A0ACC2XKS9_9TREE|nr:hypothetical protein QFC22_000767 [Naganishia vaughanmartiniae]
MDDLLDLNFAAPASNAKSVAGGVAPKPPSFDFLKNAATSRTGTPISYGLPSSSAIKPTYNLSSSATSVGVGGGTSGFPSRTATPLARPSSSNSGIINSSSKPDAFSSLFSTSSTTASLAVDDGLTLLERKQKLEAERKEKEKRDRDAFNFDGWSQGGTGSSTTPGNFLHPTPQMATTRINPVPILSMKATPARPHSSASANATKTTSSWDFDDLLAAPATVPPSKTSTRGPSPAPEPVLDPWDMAMLDKPLPTRIATPSSSIMRNHDTSNVDEDVLGLLAEPVRHPRDTPRERPATSNTADVSPAQRTTARSPAERSLSPPPHIIGQIVEMGFAPKQARKALAETDTGMNVEAALELLLARNTAGGQESDFRDPRQEDDDTSRREREQERRRRRREGPSRSTMATPTADPAGRRDIDEIPFADQADKILAQASAVGLSVFSKANSLWNVGKERAQKIIDERAAAGSSAAGREGKDGRGKAMDGRPRWMMDADVGNEHAPEDCTSDDAQLDMRAKAGRFAVSDRHPRADEREDISEPIPRHRKEKELDLLGQNGNSASAKGTSYQSPARRKRQTTQVASATASGRESPAQNRITQRAHTPPPLKRRQYTRATSTQISTSLSSKEAGNDQFKLGAYAEASDAYTRALDALPSDHLLRIPLYTNRASAYLKQGNYSGAIDDCTKVIALVGLDYHPSKEAPLDDVDAVKDIKLADGLIKALCKRAGAYEMGEKWKQAREDWEAAMSVSAASLVFSGPGGANQRKMVSEGLARAAKMCDVLERGGNDASVKPIPSTSSTATNPPVRSSSTRPPVKPKTAAQVNPAKSVGVAAMRAAASALESEDTLRFQLKNAVDNRIATWSKGKETNVRGLLASLDMVLDKDEPLWKDIKRPGMAELITDKQLKIGYMKVIARLHPDKLSAANSSVEQRMIANSVFGILNDAWHAHSGA